MNKTSFNRKIADEWSQSCSKGLLFAGIAYLIIVYLVLPLMALMVLGSWLWAPANIQLPALAFSLVWGLLWGTGNFLRLRRANH